MPLLPPLFEPKDVVTAVAKAVWQEFKAEREAAAKEILLRKMRRGKPWLWAQDETVSALFTYFRAAQEGVAVRNLELMAEAMVTAAEEPTFAPDEFRRHATRLADLNREEVLLLAELIRCRRVGLPAPAPPQEEPWVGARIERTDPGAEEAQRDGQVWNEVVQNLLARPAIFPDEKLVHGYAGALTRTGWISYIGGWDDGIFRATPLLDVIERLLEWKEAAAREQARSASR